MGTLILLYSLKISNFHFLQNWKELKGMKLNIINFFTKTLKIHLCIQLFILKYESNSNIIIKWFHLFLSMFFLNKVTYILFICITFHFFILKHPNNVTLTSFHSFLFYSFPLLKYILFNFIPFISILL